MLSSNEMGSPSPVCAAEELSDKVVSSRSYGKPKEGGYTHICGSKHTELMGAGRKSCICSEMHEKGARLPPGEGPSSKLWAAEIIWVLYSLGRHSSPHMLTLPVLTRIPLPLQLSDLKSAMPSILSPEGSISDNLY